VIPPRWEEIRDIHVRAPALRIVLPVGVAGASGTKRRAEDGGGRRRHRRRHRRRRHRRRCERLLVVFFLKNDSARPMLAATGGRFEGAGLKLVVAEEWGF
jgi:hypothetical protein